MGLKTTSTILLVDDTPENLRLLSDILANTGSRILIATSVERARSIIHDQVPDLVLLDVMMPGTNGFEFCRELKQRLRTRDVPVIFVTALVDEVHQGFEAGGDDYIPKPFRIREVLARVNNQLEKRSLLQRLQVLNDALEERVEQRTRELRESNTKLQREINERRFMQDRLDYMVNHDPVTQLHNRNALEHYINDQLSQQHKGRNPTLWFSLIQLQNFHLVNDACGSQAGDAMLQHAGRLIDHHARPGMDFCARLGGDRFAIVSHVLDPDHSGHWLSDLAQRLQAEFEWEGRVFGANASITVIPVDSTLQSFAQLLLCTDQLALKQRQQQRSLQFVPAIEVQRAIAEASHENWGLQIVDGFRHDRFELFFQRVKALNSDKHQDKVEILLRLRDSGDNTLHKPANLIRAAERYGMVVQIDRWVIDNSFRHFATRRDQLDQLSHVSINLSALSTRDRGFAAYIEDSLKRHRLPAEKFCFELTETEAVSNLDDTREFMQQLHQLGFKLALDDFGTGFASFSSLSLLPIDFIKIDGMFVRNMTDNRVHHGMVSTIVSLARLLDKPVVAEFVETPEVARELTAMGVEWAQGYFFHQPEQLSELSKAHD